MPATAETIARPLTSFSNSAPVFLIDVLRLKRARGDADCSQFRAVAAEFGAGVNATVGGAQWAMSHWLAKGVVIRTAARKAFLRDLDEVKPRSTSGTTGALLWND